MTLRANLHIQWQNVKYSAGEREVGDDEMGEVVERIGFGRFELAWRAARGGGREFLAATKAIAHALRQRENKYPMR